MQHNYWLYEEDLIEVGGVLGLSFLCTECNSLWLSEANLNETKTFGVFLNKESDFEWLIKSDES